MIEVKTYEVIEERELSALVTETYGQPFRLQQLRMYGNDSFHPIEFFADVGHANPHIWDEQIQLFTEWRNLTKPEDMSDFSWKLEMERDMGGKMFDLQILWSDMIERNLIPEGTYWLRVWW